MNIKFKSLHLYNFMSFENATINLSDCGFTLISGINKDVNDLAKSNGSGKSSIFEGIAWVLTGETIRGTKDIVNKLNLNDGAFVELVFNIDKDEYKIIRYKDYKSLGSNLKIFVNGEDKSGKGIRDSQQLLEQYLPDLNAQLLGSVIILGQGLPQRFTNNTPSGRKEILEQLSKSDFMIDDIKSKLTNRKTELSTALRQVEDAVLSDESKKSILEKQLQKLKDDKALLVPVDYDTDIKKYTTIIATVTDLQVDLQNKVIKLNNDLNKALQEYSDYNKTKQINYNHESNVLYDTLITPIKDTINNLQTKLNLKQAELNKLEAIKDVCPTCGQKLPNVHKVDTQPLKNEITELMSNLQIYQDTYKIKNEEYENKLQALKESFDKDFDAIKKEGTLIRESYNTANTELQKCNNDLSNFKLTLEKLKLNKETYEKSIKTIDLDIFNCEAELKAISEKILYNIIEKDNTKSHLDLVSKMLVIATRDFRGFLLSGIINFIDLKAKEYSKEIFETDKIDFKLDGNNIYIGYCNKQYENLSGGEKQKVDLIIQFAIRDMLSQYLNFSSNILVLDEVFDNLDDIGCQRVLSLISNKLSDVESIFIITHHTNIPIPADNEITVVKDEKGISSVQ